MTTLTFVVSFLLDMSVPKKKGKNKTLYKHHRIFNAFI